MPSTPDADLPIACSLSPSDGRRRAAEAKALRARALLGVEKVPGGRRARFVASPRVERELRGLVAAEAECCPFLAMRVEPGGREISLLVTGPPEAEPIIEGLVGA